ncbi:MAG TPA: NAD(P)/FAD-dependent oxidoreductase [Solirubrobacteraceae bacterium]|jgi:2-polyprenyl-6-methoxyphenol hydroxylase-like FAD-dependent oxidoreductase|nr:NAD(P)/FAD-dependent oxidoreductase [Solirubrobacteraceae bacterium]
MPDTDASKTIPNRADYDVAIVGASLAGCTAAMFLARSGARVALIEKSPDPQAFKRICSHYIQSSGVRPLERLGLVEPMMQAGAVRSRACAWTRWGWVDPPATSALPSGINLRRERLDPLIRGLAGDTQGVDLVLGHTVQELVYDGERVSGCRARDPHGQTLVLRARLVVGADGRGSRMAKLAGVDTKTSPHGRFAYGGYFEGPPPARYPDSALWLLDPDMVGAFPTDQDQTFYAVMPAKERLPEFRADPAAALQRFVAGIPDAPPIAQSRLVGEVVGKIDMTNVVNTPTAPGLALIGDAASAVDPLWGVGCGFALQSSEWLADSVTPALSGVEPLERGLQRYRRRHARGLKGHTREILDYATGRKINAGEKLLFSAAAYDERTAKVFEAFGSRNIGPTRMLATGIPLAVLATARRSVARRAASRSQPKPVAASGEGASEGIR